MIVNFRTRRINRGACKLTRTSILIIIIKKKHNRMKSNKSTIGWNQIEPVYSIILDFFSPSNFNTYKSKGKRIRIYEQIPKLDWQ
jgi:hypothetical protein